MSAKFSYMILSYWNEKKSHKAFGNTKSHVKIFIFLITQIVQDDICWALIFCTTLWLKGLITVISLVMTAPGCLFDSSFQ